MLGFRVQLSFYIIKKSIRSWAKPFYDFSWNIGAPEIVRRDVKRTNYFKTFEKLRLCWLGLLWLTSFKLSKLLSRSSDLIVHKLLKFCDREAKVKAFICLVNLPVYRVVSLSSTKPRDLGQSGLSPVHTVAEKWDSVDRALVAVGLVVS